jgi:hypothetical protein
VIGIWERSNNKSKEEYLAAESSTNFTALLLRRSVEFCSSKPMELLLLEPSELYVCCN